MAAHHWQLLAHEYGILKGTCECGEVKFVASERGIDNEKRIDELNTDSGQAGSGFHSWDEKASILPPGPARPELAKCKNKIEYNFKMRDWYEQNRQAILLCVEKQGVTAMLQAYGMKSNTWSRIRQRWDAVKNGAPTRMRKPGKKRDAPGGFQVAIGEEAVKSPPEKLGKMPPFPEFNDQWKEATQVAWLEAYVKLAPGQKVSAN